MKRPLALTIAILALGAAPAFFQQKKLTKMREDRRKLEAEASGLGLSTDPSVSPAEARLTKRQRGGTENLAPATAAEIVAFARDMEALKKSGGKPDEEFQRRAMEMMDRLMDLDAAGFKQIIAALRDSREISAETRGNMIAFSIMMLATDHPKAAVALFTESSDMLDKSMMGGQVISSALNRWARLDPHAASEWLRNNAEKYPEIAGDDAKRGMIAGTALSDPKLAFKLIGELDFEHPASAVQAILVSGHENPEQRNAVLLALREYLGNIPDEAEREELRDKAFEIFARTSDQEGFDSLTQWISDAAFTPEEKQHFASGLTYFTTHEDTGKWVEWLSANLPAETMSDPVRELVGEWTQQDYLSAGKWLSATPDGPAKTAAVEAYAEAVAAYEPQVAVQWAMTLPAGPGRDSTLRSIYQNWPANDPAGAAAFARDHGFLNRDFINPGE